MTQPEGLGCEVMSSGGGPGRPPSSPSFAETTFALQ